MVWPGFCPGWRFASPCVGWRYGGASRELKKARWVFVREAVPQRDVIYAETRTVCQDGEGTIRSL